MNLIQYFPKSFTPRITQIDVLSKISQAIDNNKKFIIVSAATGSGKSFIAKCIANITTSHSNDYCEDIIHYKFNTDYNTGDSGAFILTVTKNLQDQYNSFFNDISICKGKQNFKCSKDTTRTCDIGLCVCTPGCKRECLLDDNCKYYLQKKQALLSQITVLNYEQYFSFEETVNKRSVIICDEASELENKLVEYGTLRIDIDSLKHKYDIKINALPSTATMKTWLIEIYTQLVQWLKTHNLQTRNKSDITKYTNAMQLQEKLELVLQCWDKSDYILSHELYTKIWTFTPTYISEHANLIFNNAKTVVLMSATIIDHENFAKTLGIPLENYVYVDAKSEFNPDKSPIYIANNFNLNFKNLQQMLPNIVTYIKTICEHHKDERGIIHTHTQYIADYIKSHYKSSRLLVKTDDTTNEQILNIHSQCKNSILVSPSLTHGVDLKDDLARFQIIVKLPWLPLGDLRVKKLASIDRRWYINKMFSTLIQACGRGVRTVDDWCVTYVLDSSLITLLKQYQHILPEFFIKRFK